MYSQDQGAIKEYLFFLFVNDGSGGNVGTQLLKQQIQRIQFLLPSQNQYQKEKTLKCSVFIYNMRKNKQDGLNRLQKLSQDRSNKCYVIVCGGDGTVMWVVTEMVKYNIKIFNVPIGVIPLGTGNDFSRELGWGYQKSELLSSGFRNLKKQIRNWLKAKEQYFDIWDVEAEIFEDGKFEKVKGDRNELIEGKFYERSFCNYFSFGIDGKIGYSFDKHRTKTRFGNLVMYAFMGMIKTMTRTKTLDQLLDSVQIRDNKNTSDKKPLFEKVQNSNSFEQSKNSIIIKAQSSIKQTSTISSTQKYFQKNYYNILALNINSYTGGVKDIWDTAKNGFVKNGKYNEYEQVSTSDGKIQIVSFGSSMGIALQRVFGGFSKKVAQGNGPFVFNFNRYQNRPKHRTYLQIDGQFIRFTNPKRVTIRHSTLVPKGKIKVLKNISKK